MIQKTSAFIAGCFIAALFLCGCGADAAQQEKIQELENEVKRLSKAIDNNAEAGKPTNTSLKTKPSEPAAEEEEFIDDAREHTDEYSVSNDWDYPQVSARLLSERDVDNETSYDLRLMRNEIFARHGYIFQSEDLREHFGKKSAYRAMYKDVTHLLSPIEKRNIELLKKFEKLHADTPR